MMTAGANGTLRNSSRRLLNIFLASLLLGSNISTSSFSLPKASTYRQAVMACSRGPQSLSSFEKQIYSEHWLTSCLYSNLNDFPALWFTPVRTTPLLPPTSRVLWGPRSTVPWSLKDLNSLVCWKLSTLELNQGCGARSPRHCCLITQEMSWFCSDGNILSFKGWIMFGMSQTRHN